MLKPLMDFPWKRSGDGDHERALRECMATEASDRRLVDRIRANNRLILHNFACSRTQELVCDLEGCGATFEVVLVPGQIVYPRWCERHRTEHRRRSTSGFGGKPRGGDEQSEGNAPGHDERSVLSSVDPGQ